MSKRARITLDLDPEASTGEAPTTKKGSAASKAEARPAPRERSRQPRRGDAVGGKRHSARAAQPDEIPERMAAGTGAGASGAPASMDVPGAGSADASPFWKLPSLPLPAGLTLGTVVKVAAAGLVIVSAVLWLKRRP
jgi:hypothetical protein